MHKLFLLPLFSLAMGLSVYAQNSAVTVERLHRQIEKAQQMEGRETAWQLARFGRTYLAPNDAAMQRLYYETYYLPEEVFYEEEGVENGFNASDWSPDGKLLAVGMSDEGIRLYSMDDYVSYETLPGTEAGVLALAFSPDGNLLAYGGVNGQLSVVEVKTGREVSRWQTDDYIRAVAWSPNGKYVAAAGDTNEIYLYESGAREPLQVLAGHSDWIRGLSFSSDNKMVAAASDDGTATVWSVADGILLRVHRDHEDYCRDVVFNPNGEGLLTVSDDLRANLYTPAEAADPTNAWKLHEYWILAADWSDDGKKIATADNGGTIIVTDLRKDNQTYFNSVEPELPWMDIDFSPKGEQLAATAYNEISVYEMGEATPVHRIGFTEKGRDGAGAGDEVLEQILAGVLPGAIQIYPSPDGNKLAIIDGEYDVQVVDMERKELSYMILEHEDWVRNVSWSPDGRYLATGSDDMMVGVWDANDGSMQQFLSGHSDWVRDVAFSPDSKVLLSAGDDGVVRAWDPSTGEELSVTDEIGLYLMTVSWSPNQAYFAATDSESYLHLYSARNNERLSTSDAPIIVSTLQWTGEQSLSFVSQHDNTRMTWTPDGIAEAEGENTFSLQAKSKSGGEALAVDNYIVIEQPNPRLLEGHRGTVTDLRWSPDGKHLVSQAAGGELGIWNPAQEEPLAMLALPSSDEHKYVVWMKNGSFFVPGIGKAIVLSTEDIEVAEEPLMLTVDMIQRYELFDLVRDNEAILSRLSASEDYELRTSFAELFSKRAAINPDATAAAADEKIAERLRP